MNIFQIIQKKLNNFLYFFGFILEIIINLLLFFKQKQVTVSVLLRQILFTGFESLGLIAVTAVIISGMVIIQGNSITPNFISSPLIYTILISIVTRELSTLLTALFVVSRSGAAIATELGNMVLNEEVDSLLSIGISPFTYLVIPRLIGVVISVFVLSVYFNIFGLLGSALLTQAIYDLPFSSFINNAFAELTFIDVASSSIKAILFGFVISIICCYHGLKVSNSLTEVPQRTSKAVVQSIGTIVIIDIIVSVLFYV